MTIGDMSRISRADPVVVDASNVQSWVRVTSRVSIVGLAPEERVPFLVTLS